MDSLSHSHSHGIISDGKKVTVRLFGVNITEESIQNNSESQNLNHHSLRTPGTVTMSSRKQKRKPFLQWRERNPWTEEEHRNFLAGLEWVGKSKWTVISRRFVPTKTPMQIASHAQKHFLRQSRLASSASASTSFASGGPMNLRVSPPSYVVEALKVQTQGFVNNILSIMLAQQQQQQRQQQQQQHVSSIFSSN